MNHPTEVAARGRGSTTPAAMLAVALLVGAAVVGGLVGVVWTGLGGIDLFGVVVGVSAAGAVALGVLAVTRFFSFLLVLLAIRSGIDGFGLDSTSGLILTPSTVIGALFLVSALLWLGVRRRTGQMRSMALGTRWAVVFAFAAMASVPLSVAPSTSLEDALKVAAIVAMVVVLEQVFGDRPQRLPMVLGVVGLSVVIPFVIALVELNGQRFVDRNIDVERINATFIHPNALATYCTIVLAYALAVYPHVDRFWRRVAVVVGALSGCMLLFSYARASWVGAVVAVVVVAFIQDRRLLVGLAVAVVLGVTLVPSVGVRLGDLNDSGGVGYEGNSLSWRVSYWGEVLDASSDRRVVGTGLGTTPLLHREELDVHNSVLQALAEAGVLGLVAFLGWIGATAATIRRALRMPTTGLARGMVVGGAAAAANVAVQLLTENHLNAVAPLWYLAVGLGWVAAVAQGALSEDEPAPTAEARPVPSTSAPD